MLTPYHAAVRADLERFGGTVEKFIGDAVMALFGAPVAHEDDPERAVRAALAIQERARSDRQLHLRIGITSGEALVTLEARPDAGEGMAHGDVVNTAARLQNAAPVDGILVDEATYRATARAIEYAEHPSVSVKGKAEPVAVWQALAARAAFGVDVRQLGQTSLVGRARELELLNAARERAWSEREPQLVTLVGVPGIGKSRLVWELFQQLDAAPELVTWRQGRSLPYAESISFWALSEIVKAEAGILETDPEADAAEKLRRALESLDMQPSDAARLERHLRPLIGLEVEPDLRGDHRDQAFAAWRGYLESLAERRPLVLVFEDLHWADDGLLDFVDHLIEWASGVSMLVIGTTRPELLTRRPGWGGGMPNSVTLSLAPLSQAETGRLVADLVEGALIPAAVRESVLSRAEGNPLYAEEFARLVAERGRMDELPESIHGLIAARLDALAPDEKLALQHAAVVGKVFWGGAVAAIEGSDQADMDGRLHALERKQFIRRERRSSVAGETEYAFRHLLVRDVAYGQIPRAERADRHVAAAAWIESLGRPVDHAELLAQHYLSAMELSRAAGRPVDGLAPAARTALRIAGERAMSLSAFSGAARYLRAALDLTDPHESTRPLVLFSYGKAMRFSEDAGRDVLEEAEAALLAAGDPETAAEATVLQAQLAWIRGNGGACAELLDRAAQLVDPLPSSRSKALVISEVARFHMIVGRTELALARGREALAMTEELGLKEIQAHALNNIGSARVDTGDEGGLQDLERAREIAAELRSPELVRITNNLGISLWVVGEVERARQLGREAAALAVELGSPTFARHAEATLMGFDLTEGNWDEALAAIESFIDEARRGEGHVMESTSLANRACIRAARGDVAGAAEDAETALAVARRTAGLEDYTGLLGFSASLMADLGRTEQASKLFDEFLSSPTATRFLAPGLVASMVELGLGDAVESLISSVTWPRWRALLYPIARNPVEAADRWDAAGMTMDAALLRLHAARRLAGSGELTSARRQLELAIPFFEKARASRYLEQAHQLLSEVASTPSEADVSNQSRS